MADVTSTYLTFGIPKKAEGKRTFEVEIFNTRSGGLLGVIAYYPHWRQYVLLPQAHTIFNPSCLREIALYCEKMTTNHRRRR